MNRKMEGQLRQMSVPALAARCLREINCYRRGEAQDIPSCLELFHVAYLLFHCGLQPGEIVHANPQEFSDVQEVVHLRRIIIARLVRSGSNLLEQ